MPGFNSDLGMAQSYYAATAHASASTTMLRGEHAAELVVVGGGCTGLAAALHAARAGHDVVLIEGGRIGWGASGRNGGQIIPGLRKGAVELVKLYGEEHAHALFSLAIEAREAVLDLIEREAIQCDLKRTGHLVGAIRDHDMPALQHEVECLASVMDYHEAELLGPQAITSEVATDYRGGLLDRSGGHLHPLNYTLGLAEAAARAGARLHEGSPAVGIESSRERVRVATPNGSVRARYCILAGDALLGTLDRRIARYIMPIANYIATTVPLDNPAAVIAHDRAISDTRFVVNYFRLTADGRLLFGGGEKYTTRPPVDMADFVRPFMERTFPQLKGIPISHAWGGLVSVTRTRLPHVGREGPVLWAHGYSGMGTILSTLAGSVLARAIDGQAAGLDLFVSIAPPPFPGGTTLRTPLHTLAMLWFAMRDRLGV